MYKYTCVRDHTHTQYTYFSPSSMWALEMELKALGLEGRFLYLLSHLAGPTNFNSFTFLLKNVLC